MKIAIKDCCVVSKKDFNDFINYMDKFPLYPDDVKDLIRFRDSPKELTKYIEDSFDAGCNSISSNDKHDYLNTNIEL